MSPLIDPPLPYGGYAVEELRAYHYCDRGPKVGDTMEYGSRVLRLVSVDVRSSTDFERRVWPDCYVVAKLRWEEESAPGMTNA